MTAYIRIQEHRITLPPRRRRPGLVRDLVPWDDDVHSPVAALMAFNRPTGEVTVITTSGTGATAELEDFGRRLVDPGTSVLVVVRVPALTDPDTSLPRPRPGPKDLRVPVMLRDTLRPIIEGTWRALHTDTWLVAADDAWSLHCFGPCDRCLASLCVPTPRTSPPWAVFSMTSTGGDLT